MPGMAQLASTAAATGIGPTSATLAVRRGDRVTAGETVIARLAGRDA